MASRAKFCNRWMYDLVVTFTPLHLAKVGCRRQPQADPSRPPYRQTGPDHFQSKSGSPGGTATPIVIPPVGVLPSKIARSGSRWHRGFQRHQNPHPERAVPRAETERLPPQPHRYSAPGASRCKACWPRLVDVGSDPVLPMPTPVGSRSNANVKFARYAIAAQKCAHHGRGRHRVTTDHAATCESRNRPGVSR